MKYGGGPDGSFAGFAVLPAGFSELVIYISEKVIKNNNKEVYEDMQKRNLFDMIAIAFFIVCVIATNYLFDTVVLNGYSVYYVGYFFLAIVMGPCFVLSVYCTYRKK